MKLLGNRGMPSLPRQAFNAVGAAGRAARAVMQHRPVLVPPEILAQREAICLTCEENLSGRCRKCGCGVRAQWLRKTQFATEQCPLPEPKWLKWTSETLTLNH
jgi:hypothetical protein